MKTQSSVESLIQNNATSFENNFAQVQSKHKKLKWKKANTSKEIVPTSFPFRELKISHNENLQPTNIFEKKKHVDLRIC